jgi:hypothetical protein
MKREVDQRKTRKALRKLRGAATRAEGEGGPGLTEWEKEFVDGVTERLEKYGSAFRDPGKGRLDEALSARQTHITRAIDKKSRKGAKAGVSADGKAEAGAKVREAKPAVQKRSSFKAKPKADWKPRGRDINDDPARAETPTSADRRPQLKIVPGGKAG